MADKVQGAISFTPIVAIAADDDASTVNAIHHDIGGSLGGNLTYSFGANDKWYYAPNVVVTSTSTQLISVTADDYTDLVGSTGSVDAPNEVAGSVAHFTNDLTGGGGTYIDASADDVKFLFIKNKGTSDTDGTVSTDSVYLTIDATTALHTDENCIEIAANEAWMGRVNNIVDDFRIIAAQANAAGTSSSTVICTVCAVIDDGGH